MVSNEPATAENRDFHCFDAAGSAGSLLTKRSIMTLGWMHTIIVKFKNRLCTFVRLPRDAVHMTDVCRI